METEFSEPWSREARMVLPSSSPQLHPSVVWGPVLGVRCSRRVWREAIGGKDTAATALALFDRLRLREPLARAFSVGGEITEDGWRAAARVRLAFLDQTLTPAKPAKAAQRKPFAGLPREIWDDGDARWLLKVNESGGEWYFNKELHQQILWWMQLPDLLQLAAPPRRRRPLRSKKTRRPPRVPPIDQDHRTEGSGRLRAGGRSRLPYWKEKGSSGKARETRKRCAGKALSRPGGKKGGTSWSP